MKYAEIKGALALNKEAQAYVQSHYDELYDLLYEEGKTDMVMQSLSLTALFDVLSILGMNPLDQDKKLAQAGAIMMAGYMKFYAERQEKE